MTTWKLSIGSCAAIGLRKLKTDALPTTAYLMVGDKCVGNCGFCSQARSSTAAHKFLSRVIWPEVGEEIIPYLQAAYEQGHIQQVCLQFLNTPEGIATIADTLKKLAPIGVPLVVSGYVQSLEQAQQVFDAGATRLGLALDAATPELFAQVKSGSFQQRWELLQACSKAFPGKITTHLIVGLGESEEEMLAQLKACIAAGVRVGLFAFTPLPGTRLAGKEAPTIGKYRRLQMARYLLMMGVAPEELVCNSKGRIVVEQDKYAAVIAQGQAFQTSGCDGCNRPYYNERPGQVMYNYHRPLTETELALAWQESQGE